MINKQLIIKSLQININLTIPLFFYLPYKAIPFYHIFAIENIYDDKKKEK